MNEIEQAHLDKLTTLATKLGVPEHLVGGLCRYYLFGTSPGSFLSAVISNNLRRAIDYGDDKSLAGLKPLIVFMHNNLPACCWGNAENHNNWAAIAEHQGVDKLMSWLR